MSRMRCLAAAHPRTALRADRRSLRPCAWGSLTARSRGDRREIHGEKRARESAAHGRSGPDLSTPRALSSISWNILRAFSGLPPVSSCLACTSSGFSWASPFSSSSAAADRPDSASARCSAWRALRICASRGEVRPRRRGCQEKVRARAAGLSGKEGRDRKPPTLQRHSARRSPAGGSPSEPTSG